MAASRKRIREGVAMQKLFGRCRTRRAVRTRAGIVICLACSTSGCDGAGSLRGDGSDDERQDASEDVESAVESRDFTLQAPPTSMSAAAKVSTQNGGDAYVQECIAAGVPVPETVLDLDAGWRFHDLDITQPFMEPELHSARLWTFENTPQMNGPDGICMALPRAVSSGAEAEAVGVICMGWNGVTCFFANAEFVTFNQIGPFEIGELVGGADLVDAAEGVCSDCHAGENPFIIHPNDPAFILAMGAVSRRFPDAWPTPIVPDSFPGNPDPIGQLGPVTDGQQRCDFCHQQGLGGRLPLVSTDYPGYCDIVFGLATGQSPDFTPTMPPTAAGPDDDDAPVGPDAAYADHISWLDAICGRSPGGGVLIPFTPPTMMAIHPPDVESPYQCARDIRVTNAVYGATIRLYVNNVQVASAPFLDPSGGLVLSANSDFTTADLVEVSQQVGATVSSRAKAPVRDHREDYPDGLPAPIISPTPLYECASAIAVLNVPGAELTLTKTPREGRPKAYTRRSGYARTWMQGLGDPSFEVDTSFQVRQKLCSDTSPNSDLVYAIDAPSTLPPLEFDPPLTVGQPIVDFTSITQGSRVTLTEMNSLTVVVDRASVPYNSWYATVTSALGGPVAASHDIVPIQQLCDVSSNDPGLPTPQACTVETLIPRIAPPFAGDDFVVVTYSIPGSTVRVFDSGPIEIGNGSGASINLSRQLVQGEVIVVTATLPTCTVSRAYSIVVSG